MCIYYITFCTSIKVVFLHIIYPHKIAKHQINFVTGDMLSVSLGYTSNCIAFGNGEIYVGFGSQGMIGIYDADTLQYRDKIMVGDILSDVAVGHDGYIYISPEDNRIGTPYVRSFSRETKQEVSQLLLHKTGYLEPNPVNNSFVLSSMYVSPTDLYTIKYDNGKLIEQYDSPYHGDYKIGWRNRISPDGLYIFNSSGNIFKASDAKKEDLKIYIKLNKSFTDVVFDIENDRFYLAVYENTIYEYKYSTLTEVDSKYIEGRVQDMYLRDGYLIAVSRGTGNQTILQKMQVGERPVKRIDFKGYTIKDSVIHDKRSIVYFVDNINNKLVSLNYMTGEINENKVNYSPTCLDIYKGEIYVGCGENGVIYIYDGDTLTLKDWMVSWGIFNDMCIGNDGLIYLLDKYYARSLSRISKQEISKMYIFRYGIMEKHPTRNVFYFRAQGVTPALIYTFEYDNGSILNTNESPFEYKYRLGEINRISPDGELLFNSSGYVFNTGINPMYDIRYVSKLENSFIDACFDEKNNLLFTANSNTIDIYDYSTLTKLAGMEVGNKPSYVFYKDGVLLSLASDSLETIMSQELSQVIPSTPALPPASGIMLPFNADISDAVEHPEKPVIFIADAANSKVYSINVETGEFKETFIGGAIERLDYQNDTLYVTVLVWPHNSYYYLDEAQSGVIVMIDADTMEIEERFETDIAPYDIVAGRDGIMYIPYSSGKQTGINSYSMTSKQQVGTAYTRDRSIAALHPTLNRIYTFDEKLLPRVYTAFDIDNGEFVSYHDSQPYNGSYTLNANFKISPDGKYLFNSSGAIFTCSEDVTKDMSFAYKLEKVYKDVAFNMEDSKFYTAVGNNQIYVYNYEDFSQIDTISSIGEILKLFYVDGKLCAVSKNANGRPMFEIIEYPRIQYGDVNQDGEVDSLDVTYLKRYILKSKDFELPEYGLLAADVDGDGIVDSLDLTYLKRYVLRKVTELPANRK